MALDMDKPNAFMGRFVGDLGAAIHAGTVVLGDWLGLYKALAEGRMTSAELARKAECDERYVREWLAAQAAPGCVAPAPSRSRWRRSARCPSSRRCPAPGWASAGTSTIPG